MSCSGTTAPVFDSTSVSSKPRIESNGPSIVSPKIQNVVPSSSSTELTASCPVMSTSLSANWTPRSLTDATKGLSCSAIRPPPDRWSCTTGHRRGAPGRPGPGRRPARRSGVEQALRERRGERRRQRQARSAGRLDRVVDVGLALPDGPARLVGRRQLVHPGTVLLVDEVLRGVLPPEPV